MHDFVRIHSNDNNFLVCSPQLAYASLVAAAASGMEAPQDTWVPFSLLVSVGSFATLVCIVAACRAHMAGRLPLCDDGEDTLVDDAADLPEHLKTVPANQTLHMGRRTPKLSLANPPKQARLTLGSRANTASSSPVSPGQEKGSLGHAGPQPLLSLGQDSTLAKPVQRSFLGRFSAKPAKQPKLTLI